MTFSRWITGGALLAGILLSPAIAAAQDTKDTSSKDTSSKDWPNKAVRIIVNYGPGGSADNTMRLSVLPNRLPS